jgi:hypothetical protein
MPVTSETDSQIGLGRLVKIGDFDSNGGFLAKGSKTATLKA